MVSVMIVCYRTCVEQLRTTTPQPCSPGSFPAYERARTPSPPRRSRHRSQLLTISALRPSTVAASLSPSQPCAPAPSQPTSHHHPSTVAARSRRSEYDQPKTSTLLRIVRAGKEHDEPRQPPGFVVVWLRATHRATMSTGASQRGCREPREPGSSVVDPSTILESKSPRRPRHP
jgi:hypothetical protein